MAAYGKWLDEVLAEVLARFGPLSVEDGERFLFLFRQNGVADYADALERHLARRKLNVRPGRARAAQARPEMASRGAKTSDRQMNAAFNRLREEKQLKTMVQLARAVLAEGVKNDALLNILAITLMETGNSLLAARILERLLEFMTGNHVILTNLAKSLRSIGRSEEAAKYLDQALAIRPDHLSAILELAGLQMDRGDPVLAIATARRAVAVDPNFLPALNCLLFWQAFDPALSPVEQRQLAESMRRNIDVGGPHLRPAFGRNHGGKLRVGFVSGDFGLHPVGFFMAGFLEHLPKLEIETHLYSTIDRNDQLRLRFNRIATAFIDIRKLSDAAAAEKIRKDRIDILIDLAGHTGGNRLPIFAMRPAPVQATYLGYFGTTGFPEIDFIIGDAVVTPVTNAAHFVERIHQTEGCYVSFFPDTANVDPGRPAFEKNGYITFACFNRPEKVTPEVIDAWLQVLTRVPDSRLKLKQSKWLMSSTLPLLRQAMAQRGLPEHLLSIEGNAARRDYFEAYNHVDIILDTFPYMGATTTAEALAMGVPVVSLKGNHLFASLGATLLIHGEFPDLVSTDADGYVDCAVRTANRIARGELTKQMVREKADASGLFDGEKFAGKFARSLRDMISIVEREAGG